MLELGSHGSKRIMDYQLQDTDYKPSLARLTTLVSIYTE